jgi:hypothetical protein
VRTTAATPLTAPSTMLRSTQATPSKTFRPGPSTKAEMAASYFQASARIGFSIFSGATRRPR